MPDLASGVVVTRVEERARINQTKQAPRNFACSATAGYSCRTAISFQREGQINNSGRRLYGTHILKK